ncbi:NADP-dependent oxidoreductase domain-containing protein [Lactarius quietus]|nr:NADP-dependent oxidoreductase domain-containing protein [Lactarius quietus]
MPVGSSGLTDVYFCLFYSQDGDSEEFIGEWVENRGVRDQLVIATKPKCISLRLNLFCFGHADNTRSLQYTANYKRGQDDITHQVNYTGNHVKSLHISVHDSLRKLRTSYIDVLYVHWWDYNTSVEEVMNSLHILVLQGKVLYLGVSDAPAWVVAKANQYARDHGKTPFAVYQGKWSVLERSFERDIIPMARYEGLALAPWGVLAGGKIRTDADEARRRESGEKGRSVFSNWERNEEERNMSLVLEEVAKEVGVEGITAVAISYHLLKMPFVFPIIGCRKVEHLRENVKALDITLTPEQIEKIENATKFEIGFPFNTFGTGATPSFGVSSTTAHTDQVPLSQAIRPSKD